MTGSEWTDVVREVESLFGRSSKWVDRAAEAAFRRKFHAISKDAAMAAVGKLYEQGRGSAPSSSELYVEAAAMPGAFVTQTHRPCQHTEYGIVSFHDDGTADEAFCRQCRTEFRLKPSDHVRTVGDLEADSKNRDAFADVVAP